MYKYYGIVCARWAVRPTARGRLLERASGLRPESKPIRGSHPNGQQAMNNSGLNHRSWGPPVLPMRDENMVELFINS
jgi:hypothetical protein